MAFVNGTWCLSQEFAHLTHVHAVQVPTQNPFYDIPLILIEPLGLGVQVRLQANLVTSLTATNLLDTRQEGAAYAMFPMVSGSYDLR